LILESLPTLALIFIAVFFGGAIRRLSGFGGALVMTPILMWVFPVTFLIPIVLSTEIFGGIFISRQWQVHIEDRFRLYRMLIVSAIALPLGIYFGTQVPIADNKSIYLYPHYFFL
jgi:uncharacterized membrane protein YfcA